jgi:anti-anti-sigma factor
MDCKYDVSVNNGVAKFDVSGRLDSNSAPGFSEEIKKLAGQNVGSIVFLFPNLEYIASAGLRAIVFAKQKLGAETKVYVIAPRPDVLEVIKMSGFDNFVTIQDSFPD